MIPVNGEITIRQRQGRFGLFNTAILECSIGTFAVRDRSLEQFNEGVYTGVFILKHIRPYPYTVGGRIVVEIIAELDQIILSEDQFEITHDYELEQDPIIQEQNHRPNVQSVELPAGNSECDDVAELFGELWPLGAVVKLDSAAERFVLRRQKDYLGQMGYTFDQGSQCWVKR